MLVASSIYEASKYFELFQKTPSSKASALWLLPIIRRRKTSRYEDTGANTETEKEVDL